MSDQKSPMQMISLPASTTAAGTRLQVSATAYGCRFLHIAANTTNTGAVFVGGAQVAATCYHSLLYAGQEVDIPIDRVDKVWYDVAVNSEGIKSGYVV